MELPSKKIIAIRQDPRILIIFSKPKAGKTTALSLLNNNLIIDLESGTEYIDALKIEAKSVKDILEICKEIKKQEKPYKFITLDTLTALEDIAKPYALQLWKNSPMYTDKYVVKDITQVPNGSGYSFLREAIERVIGWLKEVCDQIILVCHSKDASITNTELVVKDIDLTGKVGRILASQCDAIGYLYRDDEDNTILSFNSKDKFAECKARPKHLTGKDIILIENVNGELIPHWDRIYPTEPYSGENIIKEVPKINLEDDINEEDNTNVKYNTNKEDNINKNINESSNESELKEDSDLEEDLI